MVRPALTACPARRSRPAAARFPLLHPPRAAALRIRDPKRAQHYTGPAGGHIRDPNPERAQHYTGPAQGGISGIPTPERAQRYGPSGPTPKRAQRYTTPTLRLCKDRNLASGLSGSMMPACPYLDVLRRAVLPSRPQFTAISETVRPILARAHASGCHPRHAPAPKASLALAGFREFEAARNFLAGSQSVIRIVLLE